jgi:hypothetical protein
MLRDRLGQTHHIVACCAGEVTLSFRGRPSASTPGYEPRRSMSSLGVSCENGEVGMGEHGEGDVPVPGAVEADLVVVEGDFRIPGFGKHSSMGQRAPATWTSCAKPSPRGLWQW